MRSITVSQTGAGSTAAIPMDTYRNPFHVGMGVVISGTVNYSVQHTFDNIFDSSVTPNWFDHPTLETQTVGGDGNYAFPVSAIRLTVNSGAGSATLTLIQAGMPGE